jgi:hypothetical protein
MNFTSINEYFKSLEMLPENKQSTELAKLELETKLYKAKKNRKNFKMRQDAILSISKIVNKNVTKKHLNLILSDCNN